MITSEAVTKYHQRCERVSSPQYLFHVLDGVHEVWRESEAEVRVLRSNLIDPINLSVDYSMFKLIKLIFIKSNNVLIQFGFEST